MDNLDILFEVVSFLLLAAIGIAAAIAPLVWVARTILAPIDRAAKFRVAPVSFSIADFSCLFLAIQLPLAIIYRFVREGAEGAYWTLTAITWLIAPLIWYACARTLSKAQVTNGRDRVVFLGLIMPLVYYGVIPFMALGVTIFGALVTRAPMSIQWLSVGWLTLAFLFYGCGWFVRSMLKRGPGDESPISDRDHEDGVLRVAMQDRSASAGLPRAHGGV